VEEEEVFLPELLSVDWAPSEMALLTYFLPELVNGGECLLILVEEFEYLIQEVVDVVVNPMAVL
jgi:hypothetical protein